MLQNTEEEQYYNNNEDFEEKTNENNTNEKNINENNNNEISTKEDNTNEVKQSKESTEQRQNQYQNENIKMNTQNEEKDINENKINDGDLGLFKDPAIKDILKYNEQLQETIDKLKEDYAKLKETYKEEVKKSKQLSEKIKNLEKELNDEKKKNEDLTKELEDSKKNRPKENQNVEVKATNENNVEFLQNILLKDKEISELKKKLENSILLSEGEELISIIFIYEEKKIHYSIICKNVDSLAIAEQKLFNKFQEIKDEEYDYYLKDTRLKRGYKFKEKNIENGAIITLKKRD